MKKIISIIITIISISFLAGCNMSLTFDKDKPDTPIETEVDTTEPTTDNTAEEASDETVETEHATSPDETDEETTDEPPTTSKEDLILQALAEKHGKTIDQVEISMDQEAANHVRGNVTFLPAGEMGNSGYFLAAKVSGEWKIVIDGRGTISCSLVRSYNFPEYMIADCWEEAAAVPVISKKDLIRKALAEKHNKKISQVEISMDQEADDHVRGNVTFLPAGEMSNSGYFLAAKVSGEWKIVIDGRGTISCSLVRSYNFPEYMIADCWEETAAVPTTSKEDLIRQALAEKHGKTIDQVEISMDQEAANHVRGNVTFLPAGEMGNSGYFLAAKVGGEWEIVIDGHGVISCSLVDPYNFPEDMIADCWEG